jgi:ABC-type Mn2+/Zn2+ transport system ATPase subunit
VGGGDSTVCQQASGCLENSAGHIINDDSPLRDYRYWRIGWVSNHGEGVINEYR